MEMQTERRLHADNQVLYFRNPTSDIAKAAIENLHDLTLSPRMCGAKGTLMLLDLLLCYAAA